MSGTNFVKFQVIACLKSVMTMTKVTTDGQVLVETETWLRTISKIKPIPYMNMWASKKLQKIQKCMYKRN